MKDRIDQLTILIEQIRKLDLGYPLGKNALGLTAKETQIDEVRHSHKDFKTDELLCFYGLADGLALPDVHVGFFLHSLSHILAGPSRGVPKTVSGPIADQIMVFGSDGGGGLFALAKDGTVLYLPTGAVRQGVFDGNGATVRQVADGFDSFLARLIADIRAFAKQSPDWKYLCQQSTSLGFSLVN
jgi:hypothetical protein